MSSILSVDKIGKKYEKSNFILKNISFTVPYGTIMGLVGQNGSGKTTIIHTILNIIKKDNGTIAIMGESNTDKNVQIREQIGVVVGQEQFNPHVTPEQIRKVMNGIYKNWDNDTYYKMIDQFCLPLGQKIKQLSSGMKVKLSIAVALAHSPKLLILDEPTSGLDPIVRNEILDALLDFVKDKKRGVLLSSHITTDLEKIADSITFIHKGNMILSESKNALLDSYGVISGKASDFDTIDQHDYISFYIDGTAFYALVSDRNKVLQKYSSLIHCDKFNNLDDILMFITKGVKS